MQETSPTKPTGWVGWIVFAGVFMIVAGVLGAIEGLAGILRDESYFFVPDEGLLVFDLTTWGWIHLILGIAMAVVGYLLIQGSTVGAVLFSPDGRYLLIAEASSATGARLFLVNVDTLEQRLLQSPGLTLDSDWYMPSWRN